MELNILRRTAGLALAILIPNLSLRAASEMKPGEQKQFATPQEALDSLARAAESFDAAVLKEILGPGSDDLITTGDSVADKQRAADFVVKVKEKSSVEPDKKNANRVTIVIGSDDYPLPVPLLKSNGTWHFDANAGHDEILRRRVGANELDAIEVCRGLVEAQKEYAEDKHDQAPVNQYAQQIISTSGKQDGLAWQNPDGSWSGPVGEAAAKAIQEGYKDKAQPYHGYYFKVLKGQGPNAPMGEMDYAVNGAMIGGFAIAAAPAQYKVTGVKTFIVGSDGVVYEKDLGSKTPETFGSMERFNPDKSWQITGDEAEDQTAAR